MCFDWEMYILPCLLCCIVSVAIMGFYLFRYIRAFTGPLLPPILFPLVCVVHRCEFDAKGENVSMPRIGTPSSHSLTRLSFYFPSNILIFLFSSLLSARIHNTSPSCLHIAWSETTSWSFTACSPCAAFASVSDLAPLSSPLCLFSFNSWPSWLVCEYTEENAGLEGNEMTRWKWYCWQVITATVTKCDPFVVW